ncbi:hypothetical protein [Carboxylicivirga marina]|uniref:hypothetical protein n=1 Tax=Carboxylicivirga marina TaxID=2800988 RepID=UPI0025933395|nr:hypothetical protein [uncultured Carboxylicivirga sp.]
MPLSIFKKKSIDAGTEFLHAANSIIDSTVTTQKAKGELKNQFSNLFANVQTFLAEQATERLRIDSQSKSWLSRNIRGISTLIVLLAYIFSAKLGLSPEQQTNLYQLAKLVFSFYFGSKVFEQGMPLIENFTKSLRRKGE